MSLLDNITTTLINKNYLSHVSTWLFSKLSITWLIIYFQIFLKRRTLIWLVGKILYITCAKKPKWNKICVFLFQQVFIAKSFLKIEKLIPNEKFKMFYLIKKYMVIRKKKSNMLLLDNITTTLINKNYLSHIHTWLFSNWL